MWYQYDSNQLSLYVLVQPGAKNTGVIGIQGNELKLRLSSPAIEGRANQYLLKYIAQQFKVPIKQVTLKRGAKSKHKVLIVTGSLVEPECLLP